MKRLHAFACVDEPLCYGVTLWPLTVCIALDPRQWQWWWPTPTQQDRWHGTFGVISVAWA